tara:strand:+ start:10686 stop:11108 length:423 start_codon:yes stop_codon:yes gene_type:complete
MKGWVLFLALLFPTFFVAQSTADLTVQIHNIKNDNGFVQLGLYNDASKFPKVGETYKMVRVVTNGDQRFYTFRNLPLGRYALAIYHDENANKICDTNFFGIPKEAYAFSNGIRPRFSAPSFQSCSFSLKSNKSVKIKLVY